MVRKKHRYLLAKVEFQNDKDAVTVDIDQYRLYSHISGTYTTTFGEYGFALVKASLNIRYVNEETKIFLVRIRRGAERMLSNVLMNMKTYCKKPAVYSTLHISGSIRCAQKFWIRYNRRLLTNAVKTCEDPEEKAKLIKKIKEIGTMEFTAAFKKYNVSNRNLNYVQTLKENVEKLSVDSSLIAD